jgi:hypothetical protein
LKIEFYDNDGVRHTIGMDGPVTREKVGKILDLVEVMAGTPRATAAALAFSPRKLDKLASIVISQLKDLEFTSSDARKAFEKSYGERIPLSTVSTYLSRLVDRGVLERGGGEPVLHYRVTREEQSPLRPLHPSSHSS